MLNKPKLYHLLALLILTFLLVVIRPAKDSAGTLEPTMVKKDLDSHPPSKTYVPSEIDSLLREPHYGIYGKAHLLTGVNLNDPISRAKVVKNVKAVENYQTSILQKQLEKRPIQTQGSFGHWGQWEVRAIDPKTGYKRIYTTHDSESTIAVNATDLPTSYFATGLGVKIGVWDAGSIRTNHQEYNPRATLKDGTKLSSHATLVAGIILSKGIKPSAKAIAHEANVDSYDWNNDYSELIAIAASSENDTAKISVSNQSYGYVNGWTMSGTNYTYYGDWNFGIYGISSQESDAISHAAPYFLMVRSVGNDRDDNPPLGSPIQMDDGSPVEAYDPMIHPKGDGDRKQGYDTLSEASTAKNILTVGAVDKAIISGQRDLSKAQMTAFSAWGPTDDGRVKPDLVASGKGLYTTASTSSTAYNTNFTGTSASAPLVTSIIAALTHRFRTLSGKSHMRSSTMKALLVIGANDLGTKGPDYQFGHGHVNALASLQVMERAISNPELLVIEETTMAVDEAANHIKKKRSLLATNDQLPLKVVLCWTDPPSNYNFNTDDSKPALVNNLDVRLIDPSGTIHFPYVMPYSKSFNQNDLAAPAIKTNNDVDNIEVIEVENPLLGNYSLEVFSNGVLLEDQNYTVVLQGLVQNPNSTDPEETAYELWANNYFGANWKSIPKALPQADFDNDGQTNETEFLLGSDPTDINSKLSAKILKVEKTLTEITKVTIRVSPVVAQTIGLTRILSTTDLSTADLSTTDPPTTDLEQPSPTLASTMWDGPSTTITPNSDPSNKNVDIIVEVVGPQFFFKAEFEPIQNVGN